MTRRRHDNKQCMCCHRLHMSEGVSVLLQSGNATSPSWQFQPLTAGHLLPRTHIYPWQVVNVMILAPQHAYQLCHSCCNVPACFRSCCAAYLPHTSACCDHSKQRSKLHELIDIQRAAPLRHMAGQAICQPVCDTQPDARLSFAIQNWLMTGTEALSQRSIEFAMPKRVEPSSLSLSG